MIATTTPTGRPVIHARKATYKRYGCRCQPCVDAYRAYRRAYDATPSGRARTKRKDLKRKYGITVEQYEAIKERQGDLCALCGWKGPETLAIDHDHRTGRVRGLLCRSCNVNLGRWGDDVEGLMRVVAYLKG